MAAIKDLTAKRFGKWLVLDRGANVGREPHWRCVCDCGTERLVAGNNLRNGVSASCGCALDRSKISRTHGHTVGRRISPTYHSWAGMKARCSDPAHSHYPSYGARGISVCPRWESFEQFLADMGEKPDGCSIDRRDVNGNYEPANCRWATRKEQANNTRNNRMIAALGRTQTLQQWADEIGISHGALIFRLDKAKWDVQRALTTPGRGYGGRKPRQH